MLDRTKGSLIRTTILCQKTVGTLFLKPSGIYIKQKNSSHKALKDKNGFYSQRFKICTKTNWWMLLKLKMLELISSTCDTDKTVCPKSARPN